MDPKVCIIKTEWHKDPPYDKLIQKDVIDEYINACHELQNTNAAIALKLEALEDLRI
jgi:hypothetical protein